MSRAKSRAVYPILLFMMTWLQGCSTASRLSADLPGLSEQGYFHVGGKYQKVDKEEVLVGQMYVWY